MLFFLTNIKNRASTVLPITIHMLNDFIALKICSRFACVYERSNTMPLSVSFIFLQTLNMNHIEALENTEKTTSDWPHHWLYSSYRRSCNVLSITSFICKRLTQRILWVCDFVKLFLWTHDIVVILAFDISESVLG